MWDSARELAEGKIEVVIVLDSDDPTLERYPHEFTVVAAKGVIQSDLWNMAWRHASGDIAMMAADDMVFQTPGWDTMVERAFDRWPDRIGMVYPAGAFHDRPESLFVSREWIEAAGFFTPPYFASWFADRWIWEVAARVQRSAISAKNRLRFS